MTDSTNASADNTNTDSASDAAAAATPPEAQAKILYPEDKPEQEAEAAESTDSTAEAESEGDAETEAPAGSPEKYELKLPENSVVKPEFLGKFEGIARELNLNNDQAQKVADLGNELSAEIAAAQQEAHVKEVQAWEESSRGDKEFGGDKLPENLSVAKQALEQFASPELRQMLKDSGLGNHPEVIRAFYRVGKAIAQDGTAVNGSAPKGPPKSAADVLYGKK